MFKSQHIRLIQAWLDFKINNPNPLLKSCSLELEWFRLRVINYRFWAPYFQSSLPMRKWMGTHWAMCYLESLAQAARVRGVFWLDNSYLIHCASSEHGSSWPDLSWTPCIQVCTPAFSIFSTSFLPSSIYTHRYPEPSPGENPNLFETLSPYYRAKAAN